MVAKLFLFCFVGAFVLVFSYMFIFENIAFLWCCFCLLLAFLLWLWCFVVCFVVFCSFLFLFVGVGVGSPCPIFSQVVGVALLSPSPKKISKLFRVSLDFGCLNLIYWWQSREAR